MENSIEKLISAVGELQKKNDEIQSLLGTKFNVFKLCKVNHYENRHSDIIAELLDPAGTHGLGDRFLKEFCRIANFDFKPCEEITIHREYSITNGRFDIFADAKDWVFIIENKIYASEGEAQLPRYDEWLKKNCNSKNYKLFFLTLDGRDSDSKTDVEYTTISYRREIIEWLEHCIFIAAEKPFVRESLRQYRNHIKDLTGENMENQIEEEIQNKIIENKTSFKAAWLIKQQFDNAHENLIKKLIKEAAVDGIKLSEKSDFSIVNKFSGFDYTFGKKEKNYVIRFVFENSGARDLAFGLYTEEKGNFWMDKELNLPDEQKKLARDKVVYNGWELEPPNTHGWIISAYMRDCFRDWTPDVLGEHEEENIKEEIKKCIEFLQSVISVNKELFDKFGELCTNEELTMGLC